MIKKIVELFESLKTPWTLVFGNHDAEGRADRLYLSQIIEKSNTEYCLFETGPSNIKGYGNHVINVMNGDDVVYSLQLIDSNMRHSTSSKSSAYDYIGYDQIAYFEWMHKKAQEVYNDNDIKSMAFYHIAPVELKEYYDELMEKYHPEYLGEGTIPILKDIPEILLGGEFGEKVYSSSHNSGIIDSGLITNTTHTFIGHDHVNNASVMIGNQQVTYGMKLGIASYHDKKMQGGTMIYINADNSVNISHKYMSTLN